MTEVREHLLIHPDRYIVQGDHSASLAKYKRLISLLDQNIINDWLMTKFLAYSQAPNKQIAHWVVVASPNERNGWTDPNLEAFSPENAVSSVAIAITLNLHDKNTQALPYVALYSVYPESNHDEAHDLVHEYIKKNLPNR